VSNALLIPKDYLIQERFFRHYIVVPNLAACTFMEEKYLSQIYLVSEIRK